MNHSEQFDQLIVEYLDAQRRQQAPSRGQMIARHPEFATELNSFFDNQEALVGHIPIADPAATLPPTPGPDGPGSPNVIRYFGDYELLEEIARGGMGVVIKARQVSLNRIVALKMILAGQFASPADVQRFRLEAEAAANLDHPNILPIYEVGEHDGQQYFSMKYVDGGTLAGRLKNLTAENAENAEKKTPRADFSAFSAFSAVQVLMAVARAVHFAHQRGIIHRDLKPGNILLDADDTPFVADFGLAKRIESDSKQTQTGAIVGTPTYMAPEQARSDKQLTTSVDVYALGPMLYEIITGKPPFAGPTPVDVIMQVLENEPTPPSKVRPGVDRDLATIAMKCLEKAPDKRYESAAAMADDLDRWNRGEPITARAAGPMERTIKWAKRRPAIASLLGTVMTLLLIGVPALIGLTVFAFQAADKAQKSADAELKSAVEAVRSLDRANEQSKRADMEARNQRRETAIGNLLLAQAALRERRVDLARYRLDDVPEDLRDWEWNVLFRSLDQSLYAFYDDYRSYFPSFSADGKWILTSCDDQAVRVRDALTGKTVLCLRGVIRGSFFGDRRQVVVVTFDGKSQIWDISSGRMVKEAVFSSEPRRPGVFSRNGRRYATSHQMEKWVRVFDTETGQEVFHFADKFLMGWDALNADGSRLTCGMSGQLREWNLGQRSERKLTGPPFDHTQSIYYSPDGDQLAVGSSSDGMTHFLDLKSGTKIGKIPTIISCYSPDGTRVVNLETVTRILDAKTGAAYTTMHGHRDLIYSASYSPDGTRLVTTGTDMSVRIWDVASGYDERTFATCADRILSIAVSPDGKRVAAMSGRNAHIWDSATRQLIATCVVPFRSEIHDLQFSPTGRQLLSIVGSFSGASRLQVWDPATGEPLNSPIGDVPGCRRACFHPDGRRLVTATSDGIQVRQLDTKMPDREIRCDSTLMTLSPDGAMIAVGSNRGAMVTLYRTDDLSKLFTFSASYDPGRAATEMLLFSPDNQKLVTDGDGGIQIWDIPTRQKLRTIAGAWDFRTRPRAVIRPDSERLVVVLGQSMKFWDLNTGREIMDITLPVDGLHSLCISPNGHQLYGGGFKRFAGQQLPSEHPILVWDGRPIVGHALLRNEAEQPVGFAWAAKDDRLASFSTSTAGKARTANHKNEDFLDQYAANNSVTVWDRSSGRSIRTWPVPSTFARSICFDGAGQRIATGHRDGEVRIWDAESGKLLATLKCRKPPFTALQDILAMDFSPDGTRLAVGSTDMAVHVFDLATNQVVQVLTGHRWHVGKVAFSPDGRRLYSQQENQLAMTWDTMTWNTTGETVPGDAFPNLNHSRNGRYRAQIEVNAIRIQALEDRTSDNERRRQLMAPHPNWHRRLASQFEKERNWFAAEFHLQRLLPYCNGDAAIPFRLAHAHAERGNHDKAALRYIQAILLDPNIIKPTSK